MRSPLLPALVAISILAAAPSARAQQVAVDPPARPLAVAASPRAPSRATTTRWYGWQILAALAVPDALLGAGAAFAAAGKDDPSIAFFALGGLTHLMVGPLVHRFHDRGGIFAASIALNAGLPLTGLAVATRTVPGCEPDRSPACYRRSGLALGVGAAIGVFSATALDVSALSFERVSRPPARSAQSIGVVPLFFARGAGVGVGGSF